MLYIFSFLVGGVVTAAITYFEVAGFPLLSRLAALFPIFTWLSYLFIGKLSGAEAVSRHSLFVLLGTLVAWVPYMLVIYFLAPKIGSGKAVAAGIVVFLVLATAFSLTYKRKIGCVKLKRVYEKSISKDDYGILIDWLWPRGLTKKAAAVDEWFKALAQAML